MMHGVISLSDEKSYDKTSFLLLILTLFAFLVIPLLKIFDFEKNL